MRSAIAGLVAGVAIAAAITACRQPGFLGMPQLTGTCEGACDHYLDCKGPHRPDARDGCVSDCHDVFSDPDSLRAFESLDCEDTIEYVDGDGEHTAAVPVHVPRAAR